MPDAHVVVIGAGPYGLAAAARLRRAGVETRVLGRAMDFWAAMPRGMKLRSSWDASHVGDPDGPHLLHAYERWRNLPLPRPLPLDDFVAYGRWVQARAAPELEDRRVERIGNVPRPPTIETRRAGPTRAVEAPPGDAQRHQGGAYRSPSRGFTRPGRCRPAIHPAEDSRPTIPTLAGRESGRRPTSGERVPAGDPPRRETIDRHPPSQRLKSWLRKRDVGLRRRPVQRDGDVP